MVKHGFARSLDLCAVDQAPQEQVTVLGHARMQGVHVGQKMLALLQGPQSTARVRHVPISKANFHHPAPGRSNVVWYPEAEP